MGIREIASDLVAKVEAMVQEQGGDIGAVGKIDTEKEKSIFAKELKNPSVTYKDAKEIWGFAKSAEAKDAPTNAPARAAAQTRAASGDKIAIKIPRKAPARASEAPQTRAASGESIIINIDIEQNWYININIDVTLAKELEDKIAELIANQNKNSAALIAFLAEKFNKLGEDQDAMKNLFLAAIKEIYNKLEGKDYEQLVALITDLGNQLGVDIEKIKELIGQLVQNSYEVLQMMGLQLDQLKVNNEQMAQINEAILKLSENFTDFSDEQIKHLNKLIELVVQGNMKLDQFLEILNAIKDDTGEIRDTNLKILEAIGNLDKSLVEQMTNMYNMILQQGDRTNEKLEQFLELLKNMQGAIDKLGNTVVENITNVVKAINDKKFDVGDVNVNLSGIEAMFEKLLAEIQKGNQIDADGFNAVLDKLRELIDQVGEIDLTNIETLLNDIKTLTKENGDSLKNVLLNQDTMKMILENFKNELLKQEKIEEGQLDTIIELLMNKINAGHGCDVNGAELMAKLQEILEAIKNVKCECDCNCSQEIGNNESIIEDLDKIFMARSRNNMTGIDNVTGDSTGTVTVNGQEYVVGKKYMVDGQVCIATPRGLFTTAGVKVADPD